MHDGIGLHGWIEYTLLGPDGAVKAHGISDNLITTVGDKWYAERAAAISGASGPVTGMKLGTSNTATAKTGAGAALVAYLTGSDHALDAGFPTSNTATVGPDTVRRIQWQCTWAPGEGTSVGAIQEVALVFDTLADSTSTAANTIARGLIGSVPSKGDQDSLIVTWNHDLLATSG